MWSVNAAVRSAWQCSCAGALAARGRQACELRLGWLAGWSCATKSLIAAGPVWPSAAPLLGDFEGNRDSDGYRNDDQQDEGAAHPLARVLLQPLGGHQVGGARLHILDALGHLRRAGQWGGYGQSERLNLPSVPTKQDMPGCPNCTPWLLRGSGGNRWNAQLLPTWAR